VALVSLLGCGGGEAPTPQTVERRPPPRPERKSPDVPTLSEEDKQLIAADPTTLTPEQRRKRAYALRRKIMQNPDSPAARTLEDLAKAAREGTIDPNADEGNGVVFHQRGAEPEPEGGAPPGGYRPPADEAPDSK